MGQLGALRAAAGSEPAGAGAAAVGDAAMSKGPGPTSEQRAREFAGAIAAAIGKFSDEKWQIGPWFMEITLVARKLADQLVAGELDERLVDIIKHHLPWTGEPSPDATVPGVWVPKDHMETPR